MTSWIEFDEKHHRYTLMPEGKVLQSVTGILKSAGLVDPVRFPAQERGMVRGSMIHQACQFHDEGTLDRETLDPELAPYVNAWAAFRNETGFTPTAIEFIVWDEAAGFAGQIDRLGTVAGRTWLIDIKSNICSPWCGVQLAAYWSCLDVKQKVERFAVVLKPNRYKLEPFTDSADLQVWRAALCIANWKRN